MRRCLAVLLFIGGTAYAQSQPAPAAPPQTPASSLNKQDLEQFVRHLFLWGPQIKVQLSDFKQSEVPGFSEVTVTASSGAASQSEILLVNGSKIIRGTVYDIARDPFSEILSKLTTEGAPSLGPANAPVQLVEFSDFQCGYCKREAKSLREQVLPKFGNDVRFVFKDYPLEQIHPWAKAAAVAGRCIWRQKPDAFWAFHDWMFAHQEEIKPENLRDKVVGFASMHELDTANLSECLASPAAAAEVERSTAEGKALGINSTPTMFINGRRIVGSVAEEQMAGILDYERKYAAAHRDAGPQAEAAKPGNAR